MVRQNHPLATSLLFFLLMPCRHRGKAEVQLHSFLTPAVDGSEWLTSCPGHHTPREWAPSTHLKGGWMGPMEILQTRNIFCPAQK